MLGRIAGRLRWHNITVAPLVALATTVVVSVFSIHGIVTGGRALQSALQSAAWAHELETIAAGVQGINGDLYHILTLRAAQTKGFDPAAELHPLLGECDRVAGLLAAWQRDRATPLQTARVAALIVSVRRYRGAVDFVAQMLDVDFIAAVSFMQPFDRNFREPKQSIDALVRDVQAPTASANKVKFFLVLFFKKEHLPCGLEGRLQRAIDGIGDMVKPTALTRAVRDT